MNSGERTLSFVLKFCPLCITSRALCINQNKMYQITSYRCKSKDTKQSERSGVELPLCEWMFRVCVVSDLPSTLSCVSGRIRLAAWSSLHSGCWDKLGSFFQIIVPVTPTTRFRYDHLRIHVMTRLFDSYISSMFGAFLHLFRSWNKGSGLFKRVELMDLHISRINYFTRKTVLLKTINDGKLVGGVLKFIPRFVIN